MERRATYFGWSGIVTIALPLDHESPDSVNMYVEADAELKRCVLDRIRPPNRQPGRYRDQPRCPRSLRAFNPPEICCARKPDHLLIAPKFD
jgi:hypothetical protein